MTNIYDICERKAIEAIEEERERVKRRGIVFNTIDTITGGLLTTMHKETPHYFYNDWGNLKTVAELKEFFRRENKQLIGCLPFNTPGIVGDYVVVLLRHDRDPNSISLKVTPQNSWYGSILPDPLPVLFEISANMIGSELGWYHSQWKEIHVEELDDFIKETIRYARYHFNRIKV